jgi:hypothetical protein
MSIFFAHTLTQFSVYPKISTTLQSFFDSHSNDYLEKFQPLILGNLRNLRSVYKSLQILEHRIPATLPFQLLAFQHDSSGFGGAKKKISNNYFSRVLPLFGFISRGLWVFEVWICVTVRMFLKFWPNFAQFMN